MSATPTIAVVIPLYNKAAYIRAALDSVLAQTSAVDEIIVIDDGSNDAGPLIVSGLVEGRIQLERQANAGVSAARNRGIRKARCDFVAFLDADDFYKPDFVKAMRSLIAEWPQAAVFCSGYSRAYRGGEQVDCIRAPMKPMQTGLIRNFYLSWCQQSFTNTSAIVVRRAALLACEPMFVEGERLGEDQDLWFRLAERHEVAYVNAPLSVYRMDVPASATNQSAAESLRPLPCYERLGQRLEDNRVPRHLRAAARRLLASHLLNLARRCLEAERADLALHYLMDRRSFGNALYWVRTAALVCAKRFSAGLVK